MNYTREPIIETVITPKEGCKLVIRSSKGVGQEDYYVDAVEVVSFGNALFYRSIERPKSFLVPVSDYEVIELKETKMVLKTVNLDKTVKIGKEEEKKDRKRSRRKKALSSGKIKEEVKKAEEPIKEEKKFDETHPSSTIVKKIFPPPTSLIKEKLAKFKGEEAVDGITSVEETSIKTPMPEEKKSADASEKKSKTKENSSKKEKKTAEEEKPIEENTEK